MTARLLSAAPLVAALFLYAGLAGPLRARAAQARDAYGQARRERLQAQALLSPLERGDAARRQAAAVFAQAAAGTDGMAAAIRRSVLATLEGRSVTGVRLAVQPGPPGATVRVSVTAPWSEAVRLSGELARPQSGLVLERVRLAPRDDRARVVLDLEARAFQRGP